MREGRGRRMTPSSRPNRDTQQGSVPRQLKTIATRITTKTRQKPNKKPHTLDQAHISNFVIFNS